MTDREAFEAAYAEACDKRYTIFQDFKAGWQAALASERAKQAEPVAWMALVDGVAVQTAISGDQMREHYSHVVPLYAAPPAVQQDDPRVQSQQQVGPVGRIMALADEYNRCKGYGDRFEREARDALELEVKKYTAPPAVQAEPANDPLTLARLFHATYERLAPEYGYETRPDTKDFDPESKNGRLMVRVCAEISNAVFCPSPAPPVSPDVWEVCIVLEQWAKNGLPVNLEWARNRCAELAMLLKGKK